MFGVKGFYVLASGVTQGHHDPLVFEICRNLIPKKTVGGILIKLSKLLEEVVFYIWAKKKIIHGVIDAYTIRKYPDDTKE